MPDHTRATHRTYAEPVFPRNWRCSRVWRYGNFLTVAFNFVILAHSSSSWMVKQINRLKARVETPAAGVPPAATPEDIVLLREIRDSLKK